MQNTFAGCEWRSGKGFQTDACEHVMVMLNVQKKTAAHRPNQQEHFKLNRSLDAKGKVESLGVSQNFLGGVGSSAKLHD